ncbi:tripartite motif-containing protein 14-like [Dendropsophus ebraccatus]|uniref:tripartite motif-containing protein 14-like n=1 Tax=Dendropsophus ebraccatus TaxID=150705 RepID=UPI0038313E4E
MASADPRDDVTCPNVHKETTMLRCGHHQDCIDCDMNTQEEPGMDNCTKDNPELGGATTVCTLDPTHGSPQKDTGIHCTYCIQIPVLAVKSCLICEASLCDDHLKVHSKSPEHVLTEPSTSVGHLKCSVHNELLKYVCCEDSVCICVSCVAFGDHKGHSVALLNEAFEKKKEKLKQLLENLSIKKEKTDHRIQGLQEHIRKVPERSMDVTERVAALFGDIRKKLEGLEKVVLGEISRQEAQVSQSIADLIHQLEEEKDDLSRKMGHIEELCDLTDPVAVIHDQESIGDDSQDTKDGDTEDQEDLYKNISGLSNLNEGLISETIHSGLAYIMTIAKKTFQCPDDSGLVLDIDTAGGKVIVSDDLKTATWAAVSQVRPETPGRFQYNQVLSTKGILSGRHSWDVETSDSGNWRLGVTYVSIERRGQQSVIGDNDKSWCLRKCNNQCSVIHSGRDLILPHKFTSQRFRVHLDYETGCVSFYELSVPVRHLHTFTTTFTEPLHLGFLLSNAWVRMIG